MTNKYRSLVLMDFGPSRHSSFGRYCVRCSDHYEKVAESDDPRDVEDAVKQWLNEDIWRRQSNMQDLAKKVCGMEG